MARWRTLHEIGVAAAVISQHGEGIVERYVAHQAVESKRAMDKYMKCCERLGFKAMSERKRNKITKAYGAAHRAVRKKLQIGIWMGSHASEKGKTYFY